jgi:hypothetical protein
MGDYRVATNHLFMQFKMLFRDRALSYSWFWFVLFGHLLIENRLKTYLKRFYDPFLILMHKTIYFKIFLLGKGSKCCEIKRLKRKEKKRKFLYMKNSWPNFIFIDLEENEHIIHNTFFYRIRIHKSS